MVSKNSIRRVIEGGGSFNREGERTKVEEGQIVKGEGLRG